MYNQEETIAKSDEVMQEYAENQPELKYKPIDPEEKALLFGHNDKVKNNKRCSLNCEYFNAEDNGVYRCNKYFVQTALGRECRDGDPSFQPLHEEAYFPDVDTTAKHDVVNHPSHYETGKFECFEVMREAFGDEAVKNFCICNAFKYLYRHQRKNGIEDVRKAKWYVDHFLEIIDEGLYDE